MERARPLLPFAQYLGSPSQPGLRPSIIHPLHRKPFPESQPRLRQEHRPWRHRLFDTSQQLLRLFHRTRGNRVHFARGHPRRELPVLELHAL